MRKERLEAFSDGVIAILITIMVLELRPPHAATWASLAPVWPSLLSYVLSFVYLGIYWNNHHHLLLATHRINGAVLWANLHLLFWLSLVPFATSWLGDSHGAPVPTAVYGVMLLCAGIAFTILLRSLIAADGPGSTLSAAVGSDRKGNLSLILYAAAIPLAFVKPYLADTLFAAVALIWLIPDRRIETQLR
jgi:TMEM175 potassium channel family protein